VHLLNGFGVGEHQIIVATVGLFAAEILSGQVLLLQVVQEALALTYQLHQTPVSGEVFFVLLKVTADLADTLSKQGDLTFDRTSVLF